MPQFNINITREFETLLAEFMKLRNIAIKSEAIRVALRECIEYHKRETSTSDFTELLGIGKRVALNPSPKFSSHDKIWEEL